MAKFLPILYIMLSQCETWRHMWEWW